ncbi:unnamed protein product [Rhodiola kirilowii]
MDSIVGNNTWILVDLPPGHKALGNKWIFRKKMKVDGNNDKFKARLVIQGFRQKYGMDYFDTYAPVARISTIRLLIALASIPKLLIHQMDVKIAFLNGDLEEEIYMKQPEGFVVTGQEHKFSMKDMGEAEVILGIRIERVEGGLALTQSHYIEKVLKKYKYLNCHPVNTPFESSKHLLPNKGAPVSQLEYSRVIGSLMYAMTSSRPDIAFVVGKLSQYTSNPSEDH